MDKVFQKKGIRFSLLKNTRMCFPSGKKKNKASLIEEEKERCFFSLLRTVSPFMLYFDHGLTTYIAHFNARRPMKFLIRYIVCSIFLIQVNFDHF